MRNIIIPAFLITFLISSAAFAIDSTLTTYYPSPSGNYDKMQIKKIKFALKTNTTDTPTIESIQGNPTYKGDCTSITGTEPAEIGQIVLSTTGELVVCTKTGTIQTNNPDPSINYITNDISTGDLFIYNPTKILRWGIASDFIGFTRDSDTGDLKLVAANNATSGIKKELFRVGINSNGLTIPSGQKLLLKNGDNGISNLFIDSGNTSISTPYPIVLAKPENLPATGSDAAKRIALDIQSNFAGLGMSAGGLELHSGGTNNNPEIIVKPDGNVGIGLGVGSPSKKLEVAGDVLSSGDLASKTKLVALNANGNAEVGKIDNTGNLTLAGNAISAPSAATSVASVSATGVVTGRIKLPIGACQGNDCQNGMMWLEQ